MPYIVTIRTPPESGAMECCRSTIGAGKCGHMVEQSRRAVATLDEATDEASKAVYAAEVVAQGALNDFRDAAELIEPAGGTVGPLPDGTVIEVERVSGYALAQRGEPFGLDPRLSDADKLPLIIAAFNAAQ